MLCPSILVLVSVVVSVGTSLRCAVLRNIARSAIHLTAQTLAIFAVLRFGA
jgi:hypothetical protein